MGYPCRASFSRSSRRTSGFVAKVSANPDLIQAIVGYGFPGRFQEFGTVNQPARPFLSPAAQQVLPNAGSIMASVVRPALAKLP